MNRISTSLLLKMILIAVLSILIIGSLWIGQEYFRYNKQVEEMRAEQFAIRKQLLRSHVHDVFDYIEFKRSQTETRVKENIKARVEEAHAIAMSLWENNRDKRSVEDIKYLVKETLRSIRFKNERGYYFATSLDGIEQLFAGQPEVEGINLVDIQDSRGAFVIRDMIELVRKQGEGFYSYRWTRPKTEGKDYQKISYVKLFKPFGWFIGTGEYIDDMDKEIQQEVLHRINRIKFGSDGYVFAGRWDGVSLSGPASGKNMSDIIDQNGVKIVQELIAKARGDGGFVSYVMPMLDNKRQALKLSYTEGIKDWEWYIGAGMYVDDIENSIALSRKTLSRWIQLEISQIVVALLVLILLVLLLSFTTSRKIKDAFDSFYSFFQRVETDTAEINVAQFNYVEFQQLAVAANRMLCARKKSEDELLFSEEKFSKAFNNSPDAILISSSKDDQIIDVNKGFKIISGYSREEVIGKSFKELDLWSLPDEWVRFAEVLEKGWARDVEFKIQNKSGDLRTCLLSVEFIILDGEKHIITIAKDITENKKAEKALQESEERCSRMFRSVPMGIHTYALDAEDRLVFTGANPTADSILGIDNSQLVGKYIHEAFPALVDTEVPEKYFQTCKYGTPWNTELIDYEDDNIKGAFQVHAFQTEPGKMACFFLEITERLRSEQEKTLLESQLRQVQKIEALGTLAGGIAHDFNNILTPLLLRTEMSLLDLPANSTIQNHLKEILAAGHRAKNLVKQILAFSRKSEQERIPLQFSLICQEVIKFIRASIPTTIDIKHNLQDTSYVLADPAQMHQVILNLCTNAAQAMKADEKGLLELNLSQTMIDKEGSGSLPDLEQGKYLKLSVHDTGHGMTAELQLRIFEPFFSTRGREDGTGLGLSVVHGIIAAHGGAITVKSEPNLGSTFTVYLPILEEFELREPQINVSPPSGSERILFVDDEVKLVEAYKEMLTILGYEVIGSTDPHQSLDMFRNDPNGFDLVITDMTMPGMTGIDLLKEMSRTRPDIPVILTSGYIWKNTEAEVKTLGIKKIIPKPFSMSDIAVAIREALKNE